MPAAPGYVAVLHLYLFFSTKVLKDCDEWGVGCLFMSKVLADVSSTSVASSTCVGRMLMRPLMSKVLADVSFTSYMERFCFTMCFNFHYMFV